MTQPLFNTLHHVCIVVHDLGRTLAFYESIGVGPWHDFPPLSGFTDLTVQSREAFLDMRYKYADLGNVQLQLCQPSALDCPQRRFLDTHGEGVFHLGFTVGDCDAGEAQGTGLGLAASMRGRRPDGAGFTYFDTAERAGVILEIRTGITK